MNHTTVWQFAVLALGAMMMTLPIAAAELRVGDVAPEFKLAASDGQTYRLADFRDRQVVVIAWFPKAFTGG